MGSWQAWAIESKEILFKNRGEQSNLPAKELLSLTGVIAPSSIQTGSSLLPVVCCLSLLTFRAAEGPPPGVSVRRAYSTIFGNTLVVAFFPV